MNIISYDIEITKKKKDKEDISKTLTALISEHYEINNSIEQSWTDLPYNDLKSIQSPAYLLTSFTIENVQTFLFKKETKNVKSKNELSITVVAISQKEINLILKSSFTKIRGILSNKLSPNIIEGTKVNLYPFDFEKVDVLDPSFCIKADYDLRTIKLENRDWVKLLIFIIISCVFIILFFTSPSEVLDTKTKEMKPNNLKELYSALMSLGLGFVFIEIITNVAIPKLFKPKYPSVLIKNFSNIFENNQPSVVDNKPRPKDPVV